MRKEKNPFQITSQRDVTYPLVSDHKSNFNQISGMETTSKHYADYMDFMSFSVLYFTLDRQILKHSTATSHYSLVLAPFRVCEIFIVCLHLTTTTTSVSQKKVEHLWLLTRFYFFAPK
jgi:hypothetical protein